MFPLFSVIIHFYVKFLQLSCCSLSAKKLETSTNAHNVLIKALVRSMIRYIIISSSGVLAAHVHGQPGIRGARLRSQLPFNRARHWRDPPRHDLRIRLVLHIRTTTLPVYLALPDGVCWRRLSLVTGFLDLDQLFYLYMYIICVRAILSHQPVSRVLEI